MVASGTKSSAALGFGFELLISGERFRAIMALLFKYQMSAIAKIKYVTT